MFLVSIEDVAYKIEESARLGNSARVYDLDIQNARAAIYPLLHYLHPFEATLVYLYIFKGKSQEQIADLFHITQGAVSGRIQKAAERLRYISKLPKISRNVLETVVSEFIPNKTWVQIVILMADQTSHASAARALSLSQGGVRQAFIAATRKLNDVSERLCNGETFFPSRNLIKAYSISEGVENPTHSEIIEWTRDRVVDIVELLDKVKMHYAVLVWRKSRAPKIDVLDLT